MGDEDDFDVFIEKAENIVRLYESGHDVEKENQQLQKFALLIDPSTIPSSSLNPFLVSSLVANGTKPNKLHSPDVRQRHNASKNDSNNSRNKIPNSPIVNTNTIPSLLVLVIFMVIPLFYLIYYLRTPPPCPRPIW